MVDRGEGLQQGREGGFVADVADVAGDLGKGGTEFGGEDVQPVDGGENFGFLAGDDGYVGALLEEDMRAAESNAGRGLVLCWSRREKSNTP